MAEVCGTIHGDIQYTRTVLTFFSLLPELLSRIENPNKHWLTRKPVAAALSATCATSLKHITNAINASITADVILLRSCSASLIETSDGISISWPAIAAFFEENPYSGAGSSPVTIAKTLAVGYALIRMMCVDIFGSSEVIEHFRRTFVADAAPLSAPTTVIKYRSAFHMHAGAAIAGMKTGCTTHPRLLNFANDTMTAGGGTLYINRFAQSGGGGLGGKNAGAVEGSAAWYDSGVAEEGAASVAADADPIATAWRDCTQEYTGPNKLDRTNLCAIKNGVELIINGITETIRAIRRLDRATVVQKTAAIDDVIASISANNPVLARIAAKMAVRADRTQERFDEFKSAFEKLGQIFKSIEFSARTLSRKMYSTSTDMNAQVFRNYKVVAVRPATAATAASNAALGGGGTGLAGGRRRTRRHRRRARKTRRRY